MTGVLGFIAILALAFALNAVLITVEDELPGGLDNPDGRTPPSAFTRIVVASVRWVGAVVALCMGVYFIADAASGTQRTTWDAVAFGAALVLVGAWLAWRQLRATRPPRR